MQQCQQILEVLRKLLVQVFSTKISRNVFKKALNDLKINRKKFHDFSENYFQNALENQIVQKLLEGLCAPQDE